MGIHHAYALFRGVARRARNGRARSGKADWSVPRTDHAGGLGVQGVGCTSGHNISVVPGTVQRVLAPPAARGRATVQQRQFSSVPRTRQSAWPAVSALASCRLVWKTGEPRHASHGVEAAVKHTHAAQHSSRPPSRPIFAKHVPSEHAHVLAALAHL